MSDFIDDFLWYLEIAFGWAALIFAGVLMIASILTPIILLVVFESGWFLLLYFLTPFIIAISLAICSAVETITNF